MLDLKEIKQQYIQRPIKDFLSENKIETQLNLVILKQSHEFFNKLQNQFELMINQNISEIEGCDKTFVHVDLKIQENCLPSWLQESL